MSSEELRIFQECFLSLYSAGYYEPIDPVLVYHYQMLNFFKKDSTHLVNFIAANSNQTIRVDFIDSVAVDYGYVLERLGPLPNDLERELPFSDWVTLSCWEPLQNVKTEIALGRDEQSAREYLERSFSREFLAEHSTTHENLFLKAKADGTAIREKCLGEIEEMSSPSVHSDITSSTSYRTPRSHSQSQMSYRTPRSHSQSSFDGDDGEGSRREFYQGIPTDPPPPPRGGGGWGLNWWWLIGGVGVGVGLAVYGLILRFRRRSSGEGQFLSPIDLIREKNKPILPNQI